MASTLKHRTLSGALLEEIRQAILSGRYPAGSQLRQDALAETYGVSRIPIREALFQLEAEGLVRIVPQKGAIVSELSQAEIDDVFELRALLEPRLYRRSAPSCRKPISISWSKFRQATSAPSKAEKSIGMAS